MKVAGKRSMVLLPMFFLILVSCQTAKLGIGKFQKKALVIDGNSSEWSDTLQYDTKSKIWSRVTNDSVNIYVRLMLVDDMLQRKARSFGLTVWFDTTANKTKLFGIGYPVARQPDDEKPLEAGTHRSNVDKKNADNDLLLEMQDVEIFGYNGKNDYRKYVMNESPYKPAIGKGEFNSTIYELAIPLKDLIKHRKSPFGKLVSIGIMTGKPVVKNTNGGDKPDMDGRSGGGGQPGGGMPGGGGMQPGGGGMGGGGGMQPGGEGDTDGISQNSESMEQPAILWIKAYRIVAAIKK